jgi:glycosyltransferase involved in cell wall biosynthesis
MTTVQDQLRRDRACEGDRLGHSSPSIVHVVTRYLRGGSERRVRDLVRALPEAEHHLVVGVGSQVDLAAREVDAASLTVLSTLVRQPHPWRDAATLRRLVRLIRRRGSDLVVTHQSKAGVVGRAAARMCGVPVVHSLSMASFGEGYPRWQSALFRTVEAKLARSTAAYMVVGDDLRGRYAAIGVPGDKLHVVRSGVPLPAPGEPPPRAEVCRALGLPEDRPLILSLGSLEPRKNVLALPDLLGRLTSSAAVRPYLVVAGEGPLAEPLQRALDAAGLSRDATLLGFAPDPLPLIAVADVLVLLSSAEGLSQVLVQSAATGTPFVAYDVDGVGELIELGAAGVGVSPDDLDAAASAVRSFLDGPAATTRAPIDLSSWSPDTIAEGYRRVIGTVLGVEPSTLPVLEIASAYRGQPET